MAAARKRWFFAISVFYWIFTSIIQSLRFTNDYEFFISVSTYPRGVLNFELGTDVRPEVLTTTL